MSSFLWLQGKFLTTQNIVVLAQYIGIHSFAGATGCGVLEVCESTRAEQVGGIVKWGLIGTLGVKRNKHLKKKIEVISTGTVQTLFIVLFFIN